MNIATWMTLSVEHLVQEVFAVVLDLGAPDQAAGVVDQDVDPAEAGERVGDDALDVGALGDVAADQQRFAARRLDLARDCFRGFLAGVVVNHDLAALRRERARGGGADAGRRAGDERRPCSSDPRPSLLHRLVESIVLRARGSSPRAAAHAARSRRGTRRPLRGSPRSPRGAESSCDARVRRAAKAPVARTAPARPAGCGISGSTRRAAAPTRRAPRRPCCGSSRANWCA